MYSAENDTVLDPFCGLGTTNLACMAAHRNSIGVEIDNGIADLARERLNVSANDLNKIISSRISAHLSFIESLPEEKKAKCYHNDNHQFLVKTRQETLIHISNVSKMCQFNGSIICEYDRSS
jgi:tRNA/tmRNA/rRNA uracil-C5-methylase (TrmA/RlmC/RlmD family)